MSVSLSFHFLKSNKDYFSRDNLALLLVAASAEAKLKAGFPHQEQRLNDMEILVQEEEPGLFVKELKKLRDYINVKFPASAEKAKVQP